MFIELHIIQNFAPSNLNRDESNSPKDCTFGGVRRARISSQCVKRAIRTHPSFTAATQVEPSLRTRYLSTAVTASLEKLGKNKEDASKAASIFIGEILGGMDEKKPMQSKVLFFASQEEVDTLASLINDNWEKVLASDFKSEQVIAAIKEFKKTFENRTSAPDIALFGRMLAEDPKLNLDAACQVAHAISTHRVNMEFDFFTAVDDLLAEDETGAGMMGIIGFNAATFYRYANIDLDQLNRNLGGDVDLVKKTVQGFLQASALAIPTGKQNSFAAQSLPSLMLAVVRDGSPWSLANAFERPVYPSGDQGLLDASALALDAYWAAIQGFLGESVNPQVLLVGIQPGLPNLGQFVVPDLHTWLENVTSEIDGV